MPKQTDICSHYGCGLNMLFLRNPYTRALLFTVTVFLVGIAAYKEGDKHGRQEAGTTQFTPTGTTAVMLSPDRGAVQRNGASSESIPDLFMENAFTSATLAQAVNHYVTLGETKAVRELESLASANTLLDDYGSARQFSRSERIGWVCRILFISKGKVALRAPYFGALAIPRYLRVCPLYPVVQSGSSYFVLSEGYTLSGLAEPAKDYIEYCEANGDFRADPVPVPTHAQAVQDALGLKQSPTWRSTKWSGERMRNEYDTDQESVWEFIQGQTMRLEPRL